MYLMITRYWDRQETVETVEAIPEGTAIQALLNERDAYSIIFELND